MRQPDGVAEEETLGVFRTHWKVLNRPLLLAVVSVAGFLIIQSRVREDLMAYAYLALWLGLTLSLVQVVSWWFDRTRVTNNRVIVRRGVLNRSLQSIPAASIDFVNVETNPLERLINSGNVEIESSIGRGLFVIRNVSRPLELQRSIFRAAAKPLQVEVVKMPPKDQNRDVGSIGP